MTKFRKITRITVSGRSDVAKEVKLSSMPNLVMLHSFKIHKIVKAFCNIA